MASEDRSNGRGLIQTGRIELSLNQTQCAAQICSSQIGSCKSALFRWAPVKSHRRPRSAQNSSLRLPGREGLAEVGRAQVASYQAGQLQIRFVQAEHVTATHSAVYLSRSALSKIRARELPSTSTATIHVSAVQSAAGKVALYRWP